MLSDRSSGFIGLFNTIVIVWHVVDSAEAVYNVDDYESLVHIQPESTIRTMATSYPYDQHKDGQSALRSHAAEVSKHLMEELQERLADAGVQVLDARISHLAYSPETAQAMLQRQQSNAIVAARADRRRHGGHGRNGARSAAEKRRGASGRRAQSADGEQPSRRAVRRVLDAAGHQYQYAVLIAAEAAPTQEHRT